MKENMAKETAEEKLLKMLQKSGTPVSVKAVPVKKSFKFSFSMQQLNQLLSLGFIVCVVALVLEWRSGQTLVSQNLDFNDSAHMSSTVADVALPSAKTADYYLEQINARNIFKPFDPQAIKTPTSVNLNNRLLKYKLVGIAWLDVPETASVMVEDTETKETHFLKQGEQLEGVMVKTIYTDRAVFSYENEETTIKL